ncbi:hypothetical protein AQS8620_02296 [Aquimixticola soesokkakensis]|uniref:LytTR family transcriptional regulator n=1 Tax=Aquimixticola soesokkakensis TaxID=1519096 RepID=A0A1Y5T0I5_9RHOB|nr:DUF4159 domain-containing protein [Aquimixticola soesokkakensis]SLN52407.1 hypothetical protein AQS8620_02296 [Aquimixticola soesokkakensis]
MVVFGLLGFTAPWLLLGLLGLPLLWVVLRAVPPAPLRRRFPGVVLLLGLTDRDSESDRTPWWLLLLRMLAIGALIIGFAGPILNPQPRTGGSGPLLVLLDGTWADAPDWEARMSRVDAALDEADLDGRVVAVALTTDLPAGGPQFLAPSDWRLRLAGLAPAAFEPSREEVDDWVAALSGAFDTFWLSDGVAREARAPLLAALGARGTVRVFETGRRLSALRPARVSEGRLEVPVVRLRAGEAQSVTVLAKGPDPAGIERDLAAGEVTFEVGSAEALLQLELPAELRNRITRFEVQGARSAAAVTLADDSLKRREVGLVTAREGREGLELLSQYHYLRAAFEGTADLVEGPLEDVVAAHPDVLVLADIAQLSGAERDEITDWVSAGGTLLRFAGAQLAASDVSRDSEDSLMPVRLRAGGRSVGGAMSWGEPKQLAPFASASPFFGLPVPVDVSINAQVLAQPDPDLPQRTIAALSDGTPLVTRKALGEGQVVLFHVTASAEWSSLPLSGLFVQMLERLTVTSASGTPDAAVFEGRMFTPDQVLDAQGRLRDAGAMAAVAGEDLLAGASRAVPPGLYAGLERRVAMNVFDAERSLGAADWPASVPVEGLQARVERSLMPPLLLLALALMACDALASLALTGRLRGLRALVAILGIMILVPSAPLHAQDSAAADAFALEATQDVVFAHVITGDARVDEVALAGMRGLGVTLYQRTSVEPAEAMSVDLETDELSFFPMLYWPISTAQPLPSPAAYAKLNRYLRGGGMIVFDTRDGGIAGLAGTSPEALKLREIAAPLDIPALETIPQDHVLTRAFYLLQRFPGRFDSLDVWVEAAPAGATQVEGMPFRNLNDNVTPVVIGGNDWAGAWAMTAAGLPLLPVGRGYAGEQQRELAARFGVNLVMYVLTGNYKSDQVHVPALLQRIGQ